MSYPSYQAMIEGTLDSLVARLQTVQELKTVAITEPGKLDVGRMPAAYVMLDKDVIKRGTRFLEEHTLTVVVSVIRTVRGTVHGDVELARGFQDGVALVGACYDALATDRTLSGTVKDLTITSVEYGRTPLDVGVVFWGELQVDIQTAYAPGQPTEGTLMQKVTSAGQIR